MAKDTKEFTRELATARAAAAEAAALLRGRAGAADVREKGVRDLVTAVDEAAERAILARITRDFPEDGLVAEESAGAAMVTEGRRWIIDPLDGTVNYVHGHPFSCVSIAFVDEDGPAAAVVHAPFLGEVYHAARGGGAFLNGSAIHVTATRDPARALLATGFPFKAGKGEPENYMQLVTEALLATHGVRRAGSAALDLAYVASGRVDGFFELGLKPWDVAAGLLLVTEAGGRVGGWAGGGPPLTTGNVLATNGGIHAWLEALTARYVDRL
ncbi:MAG: inositol monophosphatase [Gemmatimonadota bacterium]|nr:inositol monophosphatase [Gemmatimonadota bacterium]